MILVIDGYNLLNEMHKHKLVSENQLKMFIQKIDNYSSAKNHQAILVFDGYNNFDIYSQDYKNLSLYFAKNISADDYIKDYIYMHRTEDIAVVSSDLEIYQAALALGIVTIKSSAFLCLMNESLKNQGNSSGTHKKNSAMKLRGPLYKSSEEENPELDELMAESENIPYYKLEEEVQEAKESISKKKLSKSDKKILSIRKKL